MQLRSQRIEELNSAIPAPGLPRSWSPETTQSSRKITLIGDDLRPIFESFCPIVKPGVSRSSRNAQRLANPRARSVVANTRNSSLSGAFVTKVFEPLRTYPSPLGVAVVESL